MEAGPYVSLLGSETLILYRWQGPLVHFQNFVFVIVVCTVMRLEEESGILHVLISSQVFPCPFMSFPASSYCTVYLDLSCVWCQQWGLQVRNFQAPLVFVRGWENETGVSVLNPISYKNNSVSKRTSPWISPRWPESNLCLDDEEST